MSANFFLSSTSCIDAIEKASFWSGTIRQLNLFPLFHRQIYASEVSWTLLFYLLKKARPPGNGDLLQSCILPQNVAWAIVDIFTEGVHQLEPISKLEKGQKNQNL